MARAQFGVGQRVLRRGDLRFRRVERAGGGALRAVGHLIGGMGGEAAGEQGLLALEGGGGLAHGGLGAGEAGFRRVEIGLLFGGIETGEDGVGLDMLADFARALDHPAADPKGKFGLHPGADGPGEGQIALPGLRREFLRDDPEGRPLRLRGLAVATEKRQADQENNRRMRAQPHN